MIPHLYVHVPFCPSICPYCDFHVLTRQAGLVEAFLNKLEKDALQLSAQYGPQELQTIFLGGGTPSFLRDAEMVRLANIVRQNFGWTKSFEQGGEASLEINPGTVTPARAKLWRELGFDRASLGLQSLQNNILKFLGRTHDANQALRSLDILLNQGFRVSADLITAVPGQDMKKDFLALAQAGLQHISAYTLTIEDGTPFATRGVKVKEEDELKALELADEILATHGLARYEISNHAVPGQESKHNLAYWHNRFWFGLGPSATGHYPSVNPNFASVRIKNAPLNNWLASDQGETENVTTEEYLTDALFSGLRLKDGINICELGERVGLNVQEHFAKPIARQQAKGFLQMLGPTMRLTPAGTWQLNEVVKDFL